MFSERIALQINGNDLFYIPTVDNQNNQQSVSFKLISDNNRSYVFENMEHDFPQRIIYSHPQPDSLHARIEGDVNGTYHKEDFLMARVK